MNFATSPVLELTLPVWRSRLLLAAFVAAFLLLAGRAVYLQGWHNAFLQAKGESRYSRVIEISANRGRITDRNGEVLAVSTPVKSIWAIPDEVAMSGEQLSRLASMLELSQQEIQKRIGSAERDFAYVKRQIPPELADRVAGLRIPGLFQGREYRRYYPSGEVTAHLLGFTGADDVGQEGIELAFQGPLAGRPGSRRVIRDRRGQIVEDVESIRAAQEGQDLALALDARVQNVAFSQLKAAVESNRAKGGGIVVLDCNTGEVLALANFPTYNPNNRARLTGNQLRNRAVTDSFEPGSTLKPFTIALALERGQVTPETMVQTAPGTLTIGRATIRDAHAAGALTVEQVVQKSSNVGAAKIALSLPAESMWNTFHALGFGAAPNLGFPGEAVGKLRAFRTWRPIEQATMAYGHGISVSLIQLARAYGVFARDGELLPLSLVKTNALPQARPVVSRPRLIIAVMVDEPSAGQYYGGAVAAPVFARVMEGALRILDVPPDAPMKPIELPPEGQEVKEGV